MVAGDPELKIAQHSSSGSNKRSKSPTVGQALPKELYRHCYLNQSSHNPKVRAVTIPVLQITKLRLREVK